MCTRTEWYVVPIVWGPIAAYLFLRSLFQFTGPLPSFFDEVALPIDHLLSITPDSIVKTMLCFFLGNFIWTLLEYTLHRFLFHIDEVLPDTPAFLTLHFLMHGIHHYLPMDRYVIPPHWANPHANFSTVCALSCLRRSSSHYSSRSPNLHTFCSQWLWPMASYLERLRSVSTINLALNDKRLNLRLSKISDMTVCTTREHYVVIP